MKKIYPIIFFFTLIILVIKKVLEASFGLSYEKILGLSQIIAIKP